MSIIELMHHIVREPAPRLPEGRFTKQAEQFVDACLEKEVDMRGTLGVLLVSFWFLFLLSLGAFMTFDFFRSIAGYRKRGFRRLI